MFSASSTHSTTQLSIPPIFNASDDILLIIFGILVREEASCNFDPASSQQRRIPAQYPWTLAAVCSRWRALCFQDSMLWSYIYLPGHHCLSESNHNPRSSFILRRTLLQLKCSRGTPLFVYIDLSCHCSSHTACWEAILSCPGRWEELYFSIGGEEVLQSFLDLLTQNAAFGNLRRVSLIDEAFDSSHHQSLPFLSRYTDILSNLRSFSWTYAMELSDWTGISWNRLTSLTLKEHTLNAIKLLSLLSQCLSLAHLSLSVIDELVEDQTIVEIAGEIPEDSIIIPRLTSLTFLCSNPYEKRILPFIRLPSLTHLIFGVIDDLGFDEEPLEVLPGQLLIDVIARSRCKLTELRLHLNGKGSESEKILARLLEMAPRLQTLHTYCQVDLTILPSVLCPETAPYPCRSLTNLTLHGFRTHRFVDLLERVIISRTDSDGATHIKAMTVVEMTSYPSELEEWERDMKEKLGRYGSKGLNLQLLPYVFLSSVIRLPLIRSF